MWRAVATGHVRHADAVRVHAGLRHGFTAGVDVARLAGHRWFKNYKSALEGRGAVTRAVMKRVQTDKTVYLGEWMPQLAEALRKIYRATCIFPMGAVGKPLEPTELRPTSDHTRTGLNAATDLEGLRHSLNAYSEIAWFLQLDHFMRVSDVEAAFPMLPYHPDVWPFVMFRFYASNEATNMGLFCHLFGDFGAAGMPGTFKLFFVDVVVNMARSLNVLTLPMSVYVDDCSLIGPCAGEVDAEMTAFQQWAESVCGVSFKVIKDRVAATTQLALGFWWDSTTLTRELEERKLLQYMDMLAEFATRESLTLREMQQAAGRMQRMIMTFPPGAAWMIAPLFLLMARLKLPWHRRRTTREVRDNFLYCGRMLGAAMGRGYYSYANFERAPSVWTDASKSREYTGGGFVSACGRYSFWQYGSRAARKLIDFLEGDTVVYCCQQMAHLWRGCVVTIYCDNRAFQQSGAKGRSRASRLNDLIKELFLLMLKYEFIIEWLWISTNDNVDADHLSRDRESDFFESVYKSGCWSSDTEPIRLVGAGAKRVLPEKRGVQEVAPESAARIGKERHDSRPTPPKPAPSLNPEATAFEPVNMEALTYIQRAQAQGGCTYRPPAPPPPPPPPPRVARVGVRRGGSLMLILALFGCFCVPEGDCMPLSRIQASMSYAPTSLYEGLPRDAVGWVDTVLDNRLASSSWRKVRRGVAIWREVAEAHEWAPIIATDDRARGAKLVTMVKHMVTDTDLVWGSIQTYVWGMRTWMEAQHQADPVMGVRGWDDFMQGIKVLTWVPSEPRRRCSVDVVAKVLDAINLNSFWEVQLAFIILVLLYTFSRTECPCPKTFSGRECYDKDVHWRVEDFDVAHIGGRRALRVRFRVIKQDQRVERPEARGDGDWAVVGDVPNSKFSPIAWFTRLQRFHGRRADREGPMFLDPDGQRPLLYSKLLAQFQELQTRVGVPADELCGPHGLRVEGFNGTKAGLGVDLAVAQGLWSSAAHKRYDRFAMAQVVRIPAVIAGVDEGDDPAPVTERPAGPPPRRLRRGDVRRSTWSADAGSCSDAPDSDADDADDEGDEEGGYGSSGLASSRGSTGGGAVAEAGASTSPASPRGQSGASGLLSLTQGRGRHAEAPMGYWGSTSRPPPRARSPTGRRTPSSRSPSGALEARR